MKKSHIFLIVIIAVAIGVIMSTAGDVSSYVSFREAAALAADGSDTKVHVVGKPKKDASGQILGMEYQPAVDPNYFTFVMVDRHSEEKKVILSSPKPQDFEQSDTIVVIGSMGQEGFIADKIVLKCPSKYQDNQLKTEEKPRQAKL